MEDIKDYLNYNIEDIEWLEVLNGKYPLMKLIDRNSLMRYIEFENEKYCLENKLCTSCRTPLETYKHYEDVRGSKQLVEITLECPKCNT